MPTNAIVAPWTSRRQPELPAQHVDCARETGERAGDRHREEVVPGNVDAADRAASG